MNGEVLDNIHEEFKTIVHESGIRIHSFQEARGISGMKGLHNKVGGPSDRLEYSLQVLIGNDGRW